MADIKHHISIFTKLRCFEKAASEVERLVRDLVNSDDRTRGKVIVEKFKQSREVSSDHIDCDTHTVIVVIDPRQSRVCISPDTRDRQIDHRNQLERLCEKFTKPRGSVLIVLYGDVRKSRDLGYYKVITDAWLRTWRYNDVQAHTLATSGRIFSAIDEFNSKQRETLIDYIDKLILIPSCRRVSNVLIIGRRNHSHLRGQFQCNPLLKTSTLKQSRHFILECTKQLPNFRRTKHTEDTIVNSYYVFLPDEKDKCESGKAHSIRRYVYDSLVARKFVDSGFNNSISLGCLKIARKLWLNRFPTFNRVILLCNSGECFCDIMDDHDNVRRHVRRELRKLHIKLNGDVLPLLTSDVESDHLLSKVYTSIKCKIDYETEVAEDDIVKKKAHLATLGYNDPFIMKLYTMYAFQPSLISGAMVERR